MIEQPPGRRGPSSRPIIRTREYCTEREIPARSTREYNIIPHGENKRESCTERTIRYGRRRIMLENLSCICTSADSAVFYSDIEYRISNINALGFSLAPTRSYESTKSERHSIWNCDCLLPKPRKSNHPSASATRSNIEYRHLR